jgi:hypothetical protein
MEKACENQQQRKVPEECVMISQPASHPSFLPTKRTASSSLEHCLKEKSGIESHSIMSNRKGRLSIDAAY